ncbi:hypothetical protein Bca4012_072625 [Brassica carinata]
MSRQLGSRARRDIDTTVRRRLQENEEEIIRVPVFDNSDLIAKFKHTLIGWMFHSDGRRVESLMKHMPKRQICDVEGRALVSGVPIHYKKPETYESVGKALGVFDKADMEGSRVRVFVNGDLPLKFECKVGFENGDVVKDRHCYSCKRISHEEGTCPELNDNQRERNRLARMEQKEKEDMAMKEAFSLMQRGSYCS